MSLFTFVLEFNGGTYIAQLRGTSVKTAVKKYVHNLTTGVINIENARRRKLLAEEFLQDAPVTLKGVSNVWCLTASVTNKLALLNIVKTVGKD